MKNKILIPLAFFFLVTSCGVDEVIEGLSNTLSLNSISGTWVIDSATVSVWQENSGIISTETDNNMQGQTIEFRNNNLIFTDSNGQTNSFPFTLNVLTRTLTVHVDSNFDDVFDVTTFDLPNMQMKNPNPSSANDYEFDSALNANIYEQRTLNMIKQ